ncbi:hypothetical protein AAEX63_15615 [Luteococcus sp. H138]|uniref:hypothetical protein n=1 Tax=unclassified Luteococcus TaxID=2639923 RepID=UPI00313B63E1
MHAPVRMSADDLASIVGDIERWLAQRVGPLTEEARQANRLAELAITDSTITTVPDLAQALGVSTRTVNRLTTKVRRPVALRDDPPPAPSGSSGMDS